MRFQGKVAFITGASSGIGKACAVRLRSEGAKVFGFARRLERAQSVCDLAFQGDIRDAGSVDAAVTDCVAELGRLDVLIHAAGVIGSGGLQDTSDEEWERLFSINVDGTRRIAKATTPHLIDARGAMVILSSVCSLRPYPNVLAYCMTKAAQDMFVQCTALELAPHGVRVNAVNPGVVVTELHTVSKAVPDYAAFLDRSKTTHPLGRVGQPEEIAALCAFLASDEAGWITGGLHSIDGGRALLSAR
jgi:NAD(P)-dependent dehydrogenase (short-subunit alcohol dehydrogenase family)